MLKTTHVKYNKEDKLADMIMEEKSISASPFLSKNLMYVEDTGNGYPYSNNIVQFQTTSLSNGGHSISLKDAYILLPLVCTLSTSEAITVEQAKQSCIMKSDISPIQSVEIELNHVKVEDEFANIALYKAFIDHSTGSAIKDEFNSGLKIYHKHDAEAWRVDLGIGLRQDLVHHQNIKSDIVDDKYITYNSALKSNLLYEDTTKNGILNVESITRYGQGYFKVIDSQNYEYHHVVMIKLGDLSNFCKEVPLISNAYLDIKLRLNQVSDYTIKTKTVDDDIGSSLGVVSNNMSSSDFVPFMRASTQYDNYSGYDISGNLVPSSGDVNYSYKLQCASVTTSYGSARHHIGRPRLIFPTYSVSDTLNSDIITNPVRHLNYYGVLSSYHLDQQDYFSIKLQSSIKDIDRIIVVPILNKKNCGAYSPLKVNGLSSVTHGLNCSPIRINNLKLEVSGLPLYTQPNIYSYEHYLMEMHDTQGSKQRNGGISLSDFSNLYGYMVFDVSRSDSADINVSASYQLSGSIAKVDPLSDSLSYDFYVFMEQQRSTTIDITTGSVLK